MGTLSTASLRHRGDRLAPERDDGCRSDFAHPHGGLSGASDSAFGTGERNRNHRREYRRGRTDCQEQQGSPRTAARGEEAGRASAPARRGIGRRARMQPQPRRWPPEWPRKKLEPSAPPVAGRADCGRRSGFDSSPSPGASATGDEESRAGSGFRIRSGQRRPLAEVSDGARKGGATGGHRFQRAPDAYRLPRVPQVRASGCPGTCRRPDSGQCVQWTDGSEGRSAGSRQLHQSHAASGESSAAGFGRLRARGASMRVDSTTIFPHAMAFTASRDPHEARLEGEITAKEARALGVQWLFFPDADVNNNPDNPIHQYQVLWGESG